MIALIKTINNRISNSGIRSVDPIPEQKKIRILNSASFYGCIILFGYAILVLPLHFYNLFFINVVFGGFTLLTFLLSIYRKINLARIIAFTIYPINLLAFPFFVGRIGAEYYMILVLIMGFYIIDKKALIVVLSGYIILLFLLAKYFVLTRIYPESYNLIEAEFYFLNLGLFLTLLLIISFIFKFDSLTYQKTIEQQEQILSQKVLELENSKTLLEQLIKELNHRVKNNLQMVSSLFNIQSYKTKNKETKSALNDARNRIVSIAIMHQKLYKDNLFYEVRLKNYIEELVDYLVQSVGNADKINVSLNLADIKLRIEDTVHVGLVVNELITNAIKYGSNPQNQSQITIVILYNNPCLLINISDNGTGFPDDYTLENTDSFGLDLVKSIVSQHEGSLTINNNDGASLELQLKIPEISD